MAQTIPTISFEVFSKYTTKLKKFISDADAKALKSVEIAGNTLKFYKEEAPTQASVAAFEIELPEQDLSNLLSKISGATAGDVVIAKADGTIADGGVKLADLAKTADVTKSVSDAKSSLQTQITANKNTLDTLNGSATTAGSIKKQIADAKAELEKKITNSEYDDSALAGRVTAAEEKLTTLTGADTVTGSVAKQVKDAVSALENGQVKTNKTDIASLKSGKANKATTLAGYGITDAYTQEQTNSAIASAVANAGHLKREIVATLPAVDVADEHTIYMVAKATGTVGSGNGNGYDEYMLVVSGSSKKFEKIGDSAVDLTDYATKAYADQSEADAVKTAKSYADGLAKNYATAEQGKKADSAVQNVASGKANGTISVDGSDVAVTGLGTAAYEAKTAFDAAGTAQTKVSALEKGQVATNKTDIAGLKTRVETLEGTTFEPITEAQIDSLFA